MTTTSRRHFFKSSASISAVALLGAPALTAFGRKGGTAPMTVQEQLALTATQALAAMHSGRLTATSYVGTLIARAKAVADLNAMIFLDEAGALAAARQVDADRAAGKPLGPLAGLPIVVKDNINTQAMKTTGGTYSLRNFQPASNAPTLQKLIDAGAIVLGKSNLHEWAFGITSTNFTLGIDPISKAASRPCKNPYDPSRIPGGSSGGTAVAIAARFAPAGLGTDTGGSARVPASFCGIAGFRPSVGDGAGKGRRYVDDNAALPISTTRDTLGPMGRTVADLALLDAVIMGAQPPTARALSGLKIGIPASFWADLEDSVRQVAVAAQQKLAAAGVVFVQADLTGVMALNAEISFPIALHEPIHAIPAYLLANNAPVKTVKEVSDQVASPDVAGAFGAIQGPFNEANFHEAYLRIMGTQRPALQKLYEDYFASQGVEAVMFPTTLLTAPKIDAAKGSDKISYSVDGVAKIGQDTFGTCIRNADPCTNAGLPSLSIPAGLTAAGLPVGMQIDGPLGSDARLLAIGMGIESVWGSLKAPGISKR
jgi:Asp-tRNA(Asn)/Glu-tRNA(Gln) amidotransferase A subunit family amidase